MGNLAKYVAMGALICVLLFQRYALVPEVFKPGMCDFLGEDDKGALDSECYFSESYWEARAKFRFLATAAGAEMSSQQIVDGDYTMDFAVFRGKGPGLVVHSSATHGVEGYAGSGIQCAKLHEMALAAKSNGGQFPTDENSPTTVFVHAVNPYGMAHFRRFNEHNVDLNRNAIPPEEWAELLQRDHNIAKYEDFVDVFNPEHAPGFYDAYVGFFSRAIYNIVVHGFVNIKRAIVTGQYHNPTGIYYGGSEQEPSHRALSEFIKPFAAENTGPVTWIDVHTGLGPRGVDTLLVETAAEATEVHSWFAEAPAVDVTGPEATGDVAAGYDLSRGFVGEFYASQFENSSPPSNAAADAPGTLVVAQEFGTLPGIFVARAMILENQAFQYDPANHGFWATFTRDAFYVRTKNWKTSVAKRGVKVLNQALVRSSQKPRAAAVAAAQQQQQQQQKPPPPSQSSKSTTDAKEL